MPHAMLLEDHEPCCLVLVEVVRLVASGKLLDLVLVLLLLMFLLLLLRVPTCTVLGP